MYRVACALGAIALVATGCGGGTTEKSRPTATSTPTPSLINASGRVVISGQDHFAAETGTFYRPKCWGVGRYARLSDRTPAVVRDADGDVVRRGAIYGGVVVGGEWRVDEGARCEFSISVVRVPAQNEVYTIDVAGHLASFTAEESEQIRLEVDRSGRLPRDNESV